MTFEYKLIRFAFQYHTDETFFPVNSDTNTLDADLTALEDTWKGLESMVDQGLTRRIGLSNFNSKQIDRIIDCAVIRPFANQIECNVFFQNRTLIRHCRSNHIRPIAFAPLGSPRRQKSHSRSFVQDASQQLSSSSTNAQLMLAFLAQQEISAVVGADNEIQVQQNWQSQQVKLSKFQVQQLEQLDSNQRTFYFEYANGYEICFHDLFNS